jgi:hypothetical protein
MRSDKPFFYRRAAARCLSPDGEPQHAHDETVKKKTISKAVGQQM